MLRYDADAELNALIARYYAGEAGLWEAIRTNVHEELRRRALPAAPRHFRLRKRGEGRYEVLVEDAEAYLVP
jgi:hypothetical protein